MVWLFLFVLVPAYALLAMALGKINFLYEPVPSWNPLRWNPAMSFRRSRARSRRGVLAVDPQHARLRRVALRLCFAIGYPVAYYVARHAKRSKSLLSCCW